MKNINKIRLQLESEKKVLLDRQTAEKMFEAELA